MAILETLEVQFNASNTTTAIKNITMMAQAVRRLADSLKGLESSKFSEFADGMSQITANIPNGTQANSMDKFASAIERMVAAINGSNITGFANNLSDIGQNVQGMGNNGSRAVTDLTNDLRQAGQQAEATSNAISEATSKASRSGSLTPVSGKTGAVDDLIVSLDKVQVKAKGIQGILVAMGAKVPTKSFKNLEDAAEKVRKKYNDLKDSMNQALRSGEMTTDSAGFKQREADLDALLNQYNELILKQKQLAQEGAAFAPNPNFAKAYQGISQAVGGVKQVFGGIASSVRQANSYINTFISKIRSMGNASKKAKTDTASLTDTVKKLGKELTRVTKMLKLMVTRMALRAVIKEVGNGFKSLALHCEEFNEKMSGLINGSKQLGYSFAGMLEPIIKALQPALISLIELITKVVNALNQLFAALGGATVWHRAKAFTDDWAESIKAGNKQAKELKKTVLGFDELNQLQDKKTSGGDTSGNIVDMFEDVPIDPWFQDLAKKIEGWAEKLFNPIKSAWEKVGGWVKEKWKYALDELIKLGSSVARDFWKVWEQPETEQIFKNILIIVGEIGRTVGNLAKRFREAWDENNTGLHILEAIRDIVLIITEHLRNMATATADWADSLDFKPLLTAIQEFLESLKPVTDAIMGILEDFYKEVVLKFSKWVIESGLPELINVFKRFNEEVDWDGLRDKLSDLWDHLEPFMETIGEGLIIFIDRVTTKLKDFINGDKFAEFLDKLGKWMDTVTPEDVANGIEKLVTALVAFKVAAVAISALSGAASVIGGIVTACKGLGAIASGVSTFASAIAGLGTAIFPIIAIATGVVAAIYSLIQSYGGLEEVGKKIKDTIGEVTTKLGEFAEKIGLANTDFKHDVFDDLAEAFNKLKSALSGMKPVWDAIFFFIKETATFIGMAVMPILRDLGKMIAGAVTAFSGLLHAVSNAFSLIVGIFTGDGEKIKQSASNIWEGVKTFFKGGVDFVVGLVRGMADLILAPFRKIKYELVGDPIVVDMWNDIKKIFEDSIGAVIKFVTDLKDNIIKIFTDISNNVKEKIDALKAKFDDWKQNIDTFKTNVSTSLSNIKESFVKCFEGIRDGIKTPINAIIGFIEKLVNGLIDGVNKMTSALGSLDIDIPDWIPEIGGKKFEISIPKLDHISIPKLANGGMLNEDGFFFANHNELIGGFGNGKTAVANNEQILRSIENGVYNATVRANSSNGGSPEYISNTIMVDGVEIARAITKAQQKENRRYAPAQG